MGVRLCSIVAALSLAGAWVLSDLARQFVATGFPWNPLGSVWELPGRFGDVLIQPASLVGVHGMTFATVLLASLPLLGWRWRLSGVGLMALWIPLGVFFVWIITMTALVIKALHRQSS